LGTNHGESRLHLKYHPSVPLGNDSVRLKLLCETHPKIGRCAARAAEWERIQDRPEFNAGARTAVGVQHTEQVRFVSAQEALGAVIQCFGVVQYLARNPVVFQFNYHCAVASLSEKVIGIQLGFFGGFFARGFTSGSLSITPSKA
jgi:hypothetical protein